MMADLQQLEDIGINLGVASQAEGVSPTGRYRSVHPIPPRSTSRWPVFAWRLTNPCRCVKCANDFCGDCDLYIHDTLHTCPGCSQ
jgi:transcription initiation factor TFIIH subunit 2